ncbi:hypothetical protein BT96DRAFT_963170 [Gymnopus androsaceus JB14]|uniref:DUF833-domain-containing protein n=1 Tax=Gymnopus androsaceus JB14 TaxID=1447944 RepID=A0A6A4IE58_9AGAR|nr:hypothetical protein BT96DRAFT_963170 [Gymnopus androsaceus JB14]
MCIAFFTLDHGNYSLIICSNRDEYLDRPTRNARFHSFSTHEADPQSILSGIDDVGGGTWFGLSRTGKVALLTNITEPVSTFSSSRGSLVSSFLLSKSSKSLQEEVEELYPRDAKYAGFNLLLLAPTSAASTELQYDASFVTNAGAGGVISPRPLSAIEKSGGGFSNGIDGKGGSEWPKVKHGMQDFRDALQSLLSDGLTEAEFTDRLFELLTWKCPTTVTSRFELRNTVEVAPSPITLEKDGHVTFIERDIWKEVNGKVERMPTSSERKVCFKLDSVT